jgi:transposase
MKQPKFNSEQIVQLLKNKHIIKCGLKSISYSKEFKVLAVSQYAEGMSATQIFEKAGLSKELVGEYIPHNCLGRWRKKFEIQGETGLVNDQRGKAIGSKNGRPRTKGLSDAERIKRLEIEVAYLKAKNDFLVKLRAQRKS